jgi:S1-C subfamily serine protease
MTRLQPVIVHLTGPEQGTTRRLLGTPLRIGPGPEFEIPVTEELERPVGSPHGTLELTDSGYTLRAAAGHRIWVNGTPIEHRELEYGDLLEIGSNGPLLRFRLYPAGSSGFKSLREAFSDCLAYAQHSGGSWLGGAWTFLRRIPAEIGRQTSPLLRTIVTASMVALILAVVLLAARSARLERQLQDEARKVEGLASLLAHSTQETISAEDLADLRAELEHRLTTTTDRLDFLEERADASQRTVAEAAESILFLQGSYGFRRPGDGAPLRFALSPDGSPLIDSEGNPQVTHSGNGPTVEAFFTGTAFLASADGLVLTNRHVALPWDYDEAAQQVLQQNLEPVMHRMVGFLPDVAEPFDVELVVASETEDLAVLWCSAAVAALRPLSLSTTPPRLGQPVIVLGFPTGLQAMMARADPSFLEQIANQRLDFWQLAAALSSAGQIGPLATRGIIGQITEAAIVYDAETTSGGSGGPVLGLDGRVVAINSAVLRQFDGSNLGVPARRAVGLLELGRQRIEATER